MSPLSYYSQPRATGAAGSAHKQWAGAPSGITGVPAGIIAVAGAALLLGGASALRTVDTRRFAHDFSWGIFPFVAGLFVVVRGVERAGLTASIGHVLHSAPGNPLVSALLSAGVSAAGTNLINNVPMALVMVSAIGPAHGAAGHALVYGTLLGCDLGPNLTTTGSLSTMLWLLLLRRRGLEISSLQYLRLGVIVTPLMLLVTALILGATVYGSHCIEGGGRDAHRRRGG